MKDKQSHETIEEAIAFIQGADSSCSCNFIKSCDNCDSHLDRMKLIAKMYKISEWFLED